MREKCLHITICFTRKFSKSVIDQANLSFPQYPVEIKTIFVGANFPKTKTVLVNSNA